MPVLVDRSHVRTSLRATDCWRNGKRSRENASSEQETRDVLETTSQNAPRQGWFEGMQW